MRAAYQLKSQPKNAGGVCGWPECLLLDGGWHFSTMRSAAGISSWTLLAFVSNSCWRFAKLLFRVIYSIGAPAKRSANIGTDAAICIAAQAAGATSV